MIVSGITVEAIQITGAKALDPVTVVFQDIEPGKGQMIISCFGESWSGFWGAMGDTRTVKQFIADCDVDYIARRIWPKEQRATKNSIAYLQRIVQAVKDALTQQGYNV